MSHIRELNRPGLAQVYRVGFGQFVLKRTSPLQEACYHPPLPHHCTHAFGDTRPLSMASNSTHEFPSLIGGPPYPIDFVPSILFSILHGLLIPIFAWRVRKRVTSYLLALYSSQQNGESSHSYRIVKSQMD